MLRYEERVQKAHRHRWKTVLISSQGSLTQRCECKALPKCRAMRQVSPEGYCIILRANTELESARYGD
ncbi:MAG: hypothetical protein HQ553_15480 [Chloroflexi bacterium]|nr:hypothetical protein [Chloroflexota bacterium]